MRRGFWILSKNAIIIVAVLDLLQCNHQRLENGHFNIQWVHIELILMGLELGYISASPLPPPQLWRPAVGAADRRSALQRDRRTRCGLRGCCEQTHPAHPLHLPRALRTAHVRWGFEHGLNAARAQDRQWQEFHAGRSLICFAVSCFSASSQSCAATEKTNPCRLVMTWLWRWLSSSSSFLSELLCQIRLCSSCVRCCTDQNLSCLRCLPLPFMSDNLLLLKNKEGIKPLLITSWGFVRHWPGFQCAY